MTYPLSRLRRLRKTKGLRQMTRETRISINDLIMPFFVTRGSKIRQPIKSMPGIARLSIDNLIEALSRLYSMLLWVEPR